MPQLSNPRVTPESPEIRPGLGVEIVDVCRRLDLATRAADWDTVVVVLEEHWRTLVMSRGARPSLLTAIRSVPLSVVHRHPKAALIAASVGRQVHNLPSIKVPTRAGDIAQALRTDAASRAAELSLLTLLVKLKQGDIVDAYEHSELALPLVKAVSTDSMSPIAEAMPFWYLFAGRAAALAGREERAVTFFMIAWAQRNSDSTGQAGVMAAADIALQHALLADSNEVRRWTKIVDSAAEAASEMSTWTMIQRTRDLALLIIALGRLDLQEAEPLAERLAEDVAYDYYWPATLVNVVRYYIIIDQPGRAYRSLDVAAEMHSTQLDDRTIHASAINFARAELAEAVGQAHDVEKALSSITNGHLANLAKVCRARMALALGEPATAKRLVLTAESESRRDGTIRECRTIRAAAELALGNVEEAAKLFAPAGMAGPDQQRLLASLSPEINARMRHELKLGDALPAPLALIARREPPKAIKLTQSERQVLAHLTTQASLDEIATSLFITRNTLKTHQRALYAKLEVGSRSDAVVRAVELGLL